MINGLSQFDTPADLIGVVFVVIAVILFLLLGIHLLLSYRKNKREATLYMSLILIFGAGALIFLVLEQLILIASNVVASDAPEFKSYLEYSFNDIDVFWIAYLCACGAYLTSALAILSALFFTQSFLPEKYNKLIIIPTIMLTLYVIILVITPFEWIEVVGDWQPNHESGTDLIVNLLLFPNLYAIVVLFAYLVITLYKKGIPRWKQTLVLAIGQLFLSIGYTVEIINIPDPTITLIARFAIMLYPIIMWLGFTPPNWFKRIIGV